MLTRDPSSTCNLAAAMLGLAVLLALAACGDETPSADLQPPHSDAGSVLQDGGSFYSGSGRPDLRQAATCGDRICQKPEETLISCPSDCRPQPFAFEARIGPPDPGYIDPPLVPAGE